jgi:hypothetical protein
MVEVKIFKASYNVRREHTDEIFKGFGFRHLSDATQYYVHPNNQSFKGTTTLCQPIGEAVSLIAMLLLGLAEGRGEVKGDIYTEDGTASVFSLISPSRDWREAGVFDRDDYTVRVRADAETVRFAAYDQSGDFVSCELKDELDARQLTICLAGLLAFEMQKEDGIRRLLADYIVNPAADAFVNIHEDFYQSHKSTDYEVIYEDIAKTDLTGFAAYSSSYRVVRENMEALKAEKTGEITGFPATAFARERLIFIPELGPEFVLPPGLTSVSNAVAAGDVLATLLHGPSGTGKTISCKLICQAIGLPILDTINCTENLDEFVLGKFLPEDDRIIFRESYVTKAIREGGAVVFEEINFAKPQYLAFLNSLLDDNGFVRLDNGEVVRRHRNFRFFATMNMGYHGTKELNQALYNRFNCVIEIAALADEAIRKMLLTRAPECRPVVEKLISVYRKLKKKIESEELDIVVSPRNLENWARLAKYDGYIQAAEKTILPVAKCDRVLEDTIRGIIVLYKWQSGGR